MSTSSVGSSTSAASTAYGTTTLASSTLGKDTFLKLLVTQLQNQDPMNPMDDTQYVSQLAQFSSLEQMQTMTSSIEDSTSSQAAIKAFALIGSNIDYSTTDSSELTSGKVDSVSFVDGVPMLNVGKAEVKVADVINVY